MNIDPLIIRIGIDDQKHKPLIINQAHLRRVMREFVAYRNSARHQGIDQQLAVPQTTPVGSGSVLCRNVLGGIILDDYREAA